MPIALITIAVLLAVIVVLLILLLIPLYTRKSKMSETLSEMSGTAVSQEAAVPAAAENNADDSALSREKAESVPPSIPENIPPEQTSAPPASAPAIEEPAAESPLPATDTVGETGDILSLLRQLAKDFEVKLKYDATKQEQVDKLYKENMDYKSGILEKFKRSLVLAVIEQIDAAEKQIAFFGGAEFSEENYLKLLSFYRETASDFQDVLLQQFDVAAFRSEPNFPFDAKRQKSLKTVPTDDPAKNKFVSKSLRPGYEIDGFLLRPEMVEVYVYQ
jgi:molecular chaperone GrpE